MVAPSSLSKHKIIVLGGVGGAQKEYEELAKEHQVVFINPQTAEESVAQIKELAAKDDWDTVLSVFGQPKGHMGPELLGPLAKSLKYVGCVHAGFDKVNVEWFDSIGAWYARSRDFVNDTVSTGAMIHILNCVRRQTQMEATLRRGDWNKGFTLFPDTRGMVLGIVGMGSIGKLIRDKCYAFGMKCIYSNRKRLPVEEEKGAEYVDFHTLLKEADLIVLACPLTKETRHLLSTKEFNMMKRGVMVVNMARGPVVDEEALVEALKSGIVDRAGLDVFEYEPKIHPYLLTSERVSMTPHVSGSTVQIIRDGEVELITHWNEWRETGRPDTGVNSPGAKPVAVNGA